MYHYTDGGLRNVWLANGYKLVKTPYGKGVTIEDIPGLAKAIAGILCQKPSRLTGAEFRFVRQAMCLSQRNLGDMLGCTEQTIALWEKTKVKLPKMADTLIRAIFLEQEHPDTPLGQAIARLKEVDRIIHQRIVAREGNSGWKARVEKIETTGEAVAG